MSAHIPDDLLQDFVMGEVSEEIASHVAMHIDACPRCATRAAHAEPLAQAFAAVDDPLLPESLIDDVLYAVERERSRRLPALEIAIGAALLAAAAVLVALGSDPVSLIADSIGAVPRISGLIAQSSASVLTLAMAVGLLVIGSTLAVRRSLRRSS